MAANLSHKLLPPPPPSDGEADTNEADFGTLDMFDSNSMQAPVLAQVTDLSASNKRPRDKSNKRRASKHSDDLAGANGHGDALEAAAPCSPSTKKHKNTDSSPESNRKRRKADGGLLARTSSDVPEPLQSRRKDQIPAADSIPEENIEPDSQNSPSSASSPHRSQERESQSREGSAESQAPSQTADGSTRDGVYVPGFDVGALALEAWKEFLQKGTSQQPDTKMPDAAPNTVEAPVEKATETPRRARSTRKKAKPTYFEQPVPEESLDALGQLSSSSATRTKPRRTKRSATKNGSRRQRKADRVDVADDEDSYSRTGFKQGKFSDAELSRIAHAIECFRDEKHMEQRDVNEIIQAPGGTTAGQEHAELWSRIFAECPDRHRQKVINISRKKFHNFVARGSWTVEQDDELASLINTYGTKWSHIGGIINRHPEDIRDRFRNYLVCGAAQKKEAWDNDEEARLTQYIHEAMKEIDRVRGEKPGHEIHNKSYEELIDWQYISERMNRTRSRLQCITKWKSMNLRLNSKDKLASADPDSNVSFRLEKARRQLENMPDTEKYRLVLAIHGTVEGATNKIPWQKICDKKFRSQWHRSTQELVWHRLKQSVPGWRTRLVGECAQYLVDKYNQDDELPCIDGAGFDDGEEMELMALVPFKDNKEKQRVSPAKLSEADMQGDEPDSSEPQPAQELQIDPALSEVPQSASNGTRAKRTLNGQRPAARKHMGSTERDGRR